VTEVVVIILQYGCDTRLRDSQTVFCFTIAYEKADNKKKGRKVIGYSKNVFII
jgi:hypothetical protein